MPPSPPARTPSAGSIRATHPQRKREPASGPPPAFGATGLYYSAILYPTRKLLADALQLLIVARIPLEGASDHGVSKAIYLRDLDDNGVESYRDQPKNQWPQKSDGSIEMFTHPLDLNALLRKLER
jgi:catechol 2,3-dioxygenase